MMTQTPFLKTLQTKMGAINWDNSAKTVEAGLQKLPAITDINVVLVTETFGINLTGNSNGDLNFKS